MSNKIYSLETKSWVDNHSGCNDFYEDDLYDNPSVRIPVMFCIDTGKTMFKKLDDGQTKLEKAQETATTTARPSSTPANSCCTTRKAVNAWSAALR